MLPELVYAAAADFASAMPRFARNAYRMARADEPVPAVGGGSEHKGCAAESAKCC